jgi:effector-binding domain-containing protein
VAAYRVDIREVVPQLLAVVRDRATSATLVAKILGSPVWDYMRAHGIKSGGHNVVVYFDEGGPEFRIEIGADVFERFEGSDGVVCSATPGGIVAATRHVGPYSLLSEAHSAIHAWCRLNRRSHTGTSWEIYGHWNDDPTKLTTDVFYLLEDEA